MERYIMKLLGKGNTAEVFEYVDGKICKLFYEGYKEIMYEKDYFNVYMFKYYAKLYSVCFLCRSIRGWNEK